MEKNKEKENKFINPKYPKCYACGKIMEPDLNKINWMTGKWDEHSFRCECMPNFTLCVG
jgi:hypothetical protein